MKGRTMRKFLAIFAAFIVAVGAIGVAPKQVEATGNCSTGYIIFYKDANLSGYNVKFCYGVNDTDIESEPFPPAVMGPLADGAYKDDFDAIGSASGISSLYIYDNPNDGVVVNACIYYGKSYGTVMGWVDSGGYNLGVAANDAMGSFRFTSGVSQLSC